MDTRVIPSENVSTDHRMVVATIRFFDLDIVIFLHLSIRACIARYVHNLLVIIWFFSHVRIVFFLFV